MSLPLWTTERKRRKSLKRRQTAAAKALKAGKPEPERRKPRHRRCRPGRHWAATPTPAPTSAAAPAECLVPIPTPPRAVSAVFAPSSAPPPLSPSLEELPLAHAEEVNVGEDLGKDLRFCQVSFLLKFPDAGTGQSESLKQFLMQEYHEQSAEDIGQMAEDIRQNRRSSELLRLALRYARASDHARQTIKETMQSMTINCECDGFCRTAGHKAKCECGSRDSVRRGCILGPSDLDHAPGSEGHEGQTQERHDAEDLGYWLTEECLPCCQLPAAWWNAWWRENQMLVQGFQLGSEGRLKRHIKSKLGPAEGTPPPPISGCEWLNRYATDKQKFLPPFELALAVPAVVFQCQSRCRCQAICHPCHLNVTRFRPLVVGRAAANAEAAGLTVEFFESKGFEDYSSAAQSV